MSPTNKDIRTFINEISAADCKKSFSSWFMPSPQKSNKVNPFIDREHSKPTTKLEIEKQVSNSTLTRSQPTFNKLIFKYFNFHFKPPSSLFSLNLFEAVDMRIFLNSPYVIAGNELQGTISIKCHNTSFIQEFIYNTERMKVSFSGTEAVNDAIKSKLEFISIPVLDLCQTSDIMPFHTNTSATETQHLAIPFSISLPSELTSTFISKKGSIKYQIIGELEYRDQTGQLCSVSSKERVLIFENLALNECDNLNSSVSCSRNYKGVDLRVSLARSTWMSGAPMSITAQIRDYTTENSIHILKVQIMRYQRFYSSNDLVTPVKMSTKAISQTTYNEQTLLNSLGSSSNDFLSIRLNIPLNAATVMDHKLIQVTYSLQILLSCSKNTALEKVIEIPITLAHPISIHPPPGKHINSPIIKGPIRHESKGVSVNSPCSSFSLSSTPSSRPSLKKSFSGWSSRLSRAFSSSTRSASSITSYNTVSQTGTVRFGCVAGPKKYGHNPGCLRNTNLDLQNYFDVAKKR